MRMPPTGMTDAEDSLPPQPPLAPMSLRSRWWLGARILLGAWLVLLPFWLCRELARVLERHDLLSPGLLVLFALGILACLPLWAAAVWRERIAIGDVERLVEAARAGQGKPQGTGASIRADAA